MKVAVIDYGSGNLRSCAKAFERASRDASLGCDVIISADVDEIANADRIVLPGVGAFADCRSGLDGVPGLVETLNREVVEKQKPFFGICVGMQLMADIGREFGDTPGLGWIGGEVVALEPGEGDLKIPHMGWNNLKAAHPHPLLGGVDDGEHAYFVHSYKFVPASDDAVIASVDYGGTITAVVAKDNMVGTQFHPEKSQNVGQKIITNFLQWKP